MQRRYQGVWLSIPLVWGGLVLAGGLNAQTGYRLQGTGALGKDKQGAAYSAAVALNATGRVVCNSYVYSLGGNFLGIAPFLLDRGTILRLGNLGTDSAGQTTISVAGINASAQIAGSATIYDSKHLLLGNAGFIYRNGIFTTTGNFGTDGNGLYSSSATGINDAGQVVGYSSLYDAKHNAVGIAAFLYADNTMTNLGNFGTGGYGVSFSQAQGINNAGQVVGYSSVYNAKHALLGTAPFLWQNNTLVNLGNLGTDRIGATNGCATAINGKGQIVGYMSKFDARYNSLGDRAFLYKNGQMTDLGALNASASGASFSRAYALNDKGQVVGVSNLYDNTGNSTTVAALWQNGVPVDLNTFLPANSGWHLDQANGINNRGQICGTGHHNASTEGFLLTPYLPGDFNGDGYADVLFQNNGTGDIQLFTMSGVSRLSTLTIARNVPLAWQIVATPDLNGDGYADIVWQNSQTGDIAYWLLNNGNVVGSGYLAFGASLDGKVVGSGDFNGDGSPDLVLQSQTTGDVTVWYLHGTTFFASDLITPGVGSTWRVTGVADMNNDGSPDLLWRNTATGDVAVWLMNGRSLVQSSVLATGISLDWHLVGAGDYGGDGNASLLWQNGQTGDTYVWLMNGLGIVGNAPVAIGGGTNWQVVGPR